MCQVLFKKLLMQWPVNQVPMRRQLITTTTATLIPLALQFSSVAHAMIWTAACQASLSITNSWNLLKLMSIESVMLSNHLILCRPLLLPPSIFPSIRVFSDKSVLCIRWPKYWVSTSASVLPMNIQDWFTLGWTGWISLHPRDSQESFPTQQFKSINSSVLSFLYSPTLTSIHDYWASYLSP